MSGDRFTVPVTGQPIPKGWFGRLVRFMNSLILTGDEKNLLVRRTEAGTTITLSPAVLQALEKAGGAPGPAGGATGIRAAVSGGTASITLTGGTGSVILQPGANVTIEQGPNGEIIISATGGTGSSFHAPDYSTILESDPAFGTVYSFNQPCWIAGEAKAFEHTDGNDVFLLGDVDLYIGSMQQYILQYQDIITGIPASISPCFWSHVLVPIPANTSFHLETQFTSNDYPNRGDQIRRLSVYASL